MNPKLKDPRNAAGVFIIMAAFAIHMISLVTNQVPEWLSIAGVVMYLIGFYLLILGGK